MVITRALSTTVAAAVLGAAAFLGAGVASAHVSTNPDASTPQKGGSGTIVFRVPNEEADAGTVGVEVDFKPEYAISSVRYQPIPGWKAEVTKTTLSTPVKNGKNLDVTNPVTKIVFTALPGGGIAKGDTEFQEFKVTASTLPSNVDQLVLPVVQTYDGGKVVNWNQESAGGAEPEHPAPVVELAAAGSEGGHDHTDATAASTTAGPADTMDSTARWLGGAGLIVGALGLGFGGGAILRARKAGK
ncbi:YcnI family protein [Amycolatopsis rhizosphaerae]|uniref:YcnI family protein n=1 Tax=Amycolatopsis rhizosphaerae TaxID=2053003 RepID=A0A558CPD6_9PSEU|nr:YcnI family protein [Amycolatopsis rhizosphaerae]TVT50633.1 YcnI family protein [Amycolatopsis rhizosphaerae]